ncbi:protein LSM12-like [Haliotis cracherodii]|uniref:protein LSM12-like n=1 Tax=Haliotis cracherodii TaxID=6455 RepID=UPI0039E9EB45
MRMAAEYFSIGSSVAITTCHNIEYRGEVLAFDWTSKVLAIKSDPTNGARGQSDVKLINLALVSDVKVLKEAEDPPQALTNLNLPRIKSRLRDSLDEKRRQVNYVGVGVPPEGQKIFFAITKTISDVRWDGSNIIVMDEVVIKPPYRYEDCSARKSESSQALQHVRKIVSKFLQEESSQAERKSMSPSPAPSSSSST